MKVITRLYENQFVICHFAITESERDKWITEAKKNGEDTNSYINQKISNEIDAKIFNEYTYVTVGKKDISILVNEKGKKILGVARCVCLPYISKLVLPKVIDKSDYERFSFNHTYDMLLEMLHITELKHGYYLLKNANTIDNFSIINFEVQAYRNNKIIDIQTFHEYSVSYGKFDSSYFLGHKTGDYIDFNIGTEKVKYKIYITKVSRCVYYEENDYDKEKLNKLGYKNYKEYQEAMFDAIIRRDTLDYFADYILDFSAKNSDLTLAQLTIDFYEEKKFLPFKKYNANKKEKENQFLKVYLLEIFNKMLSINDDGSLNIDINNSKKAYSYVHKYLSTFNYNEKIDMNSDEVEYDVMKYKFLEYCDNEGIIKGIKFIY